MEHALVRRFSTESRNEMFVFTQITEKVSMFIFDVLFFSLFVPIEFLQRFFFRQIPYLGFFPEIIPALAGPDRLVTVTPDLVRDQVKLSSTDIEDQKVTDFIKDAEAVIEEETGISIDYTDCSQAEAAAIKNLAAMCAQAYRSATSVSADGLLFLEFSRVR